MDITAFIEFEKAFDRIPHEGLAGNIVEGERENRIQLQLKLLTVSIIKILNGAAVLLMI